MAAERKVQAGSAAALAAGLIDWALAKWAFPHGVDATGQALILAAVPGVLAYAAGWLAPHTARGGTYLPVAPLPQPQPLPPPPETGNVTVQPYSNPSSGTGGSQM